MDPSTPIDLGHYWRRRDEDRRGGRAGVRCPSENRLTQRWGRAIYEDLEGFAGIRYRGAHQNGICVAGWERQSEPLAFDPAEDFSLRSKTLWGRVVVALADQGRVAKRITVSACPTCQRTDKKGDGTALINVGADDCAYGYTVQKPRDCVGELRHANVPDPA